MGHQEEISMIFPVQILIKKLKAIAIIKSSNLDLDDEGIIKPPQSVFLGGMTKGTLGNDNATSMHFDFLSFLLLSINIIMNLKSHNFLVNLTIFQNATHDFGYLEVGRSVLAIQEFIEKNEKNIVLAGHHK